MCYHTDTDLTHLIDTRIMKPLSTRRLTWRIRRLSREGFTRFIADLWSAAGWQTEIDGSLVIARQNDRTQHILVGYAGWLSQWRRPTPIEADIDVVVSPTRWNPRVPEGPTVVDIDDLHERLRYAISPEDASRLTQTHLGVPFRYTPRRIRPPVDPARVGLVALAVMLFVLTVISLTVLGIPGVIEPGEATQTTVPIENTTIEPPGSAVADADHALTTNSSAGVAIGPTVIIGTSNGLRAFGAQDGTPIWTRADLDDTWRAAPTAANGTIFTSDRSGTVHALRADSGLTRWNASISNTSISASPTIIDETVLIGTHEHGVVALNASDGTPRWNASVLDRISHPPTPMKDGVIISNASGAIEARSVDTGTHLWDVETHTDLSNPTTLARDERVVVISADGRFVGVDSTDGSVDWETDVNASLITAQSTLRNETVYSILDNGSVVALDSDTGTVEWTTPVTPAGLLPPASVTEETVFMAGLDSRLYGIDKESGNLTVQTFPLIVPMDRPITSDETSAYLLLGNGELLAFSPEDGSIHWEQQILDIPVTPDSIAELNPGQDQSLTISRTRSTVPIVMDAARDGSAMDTFSQNSSGAPVHTPAVDSPDPNTPFIASDMDAPDIVDVGDTVTLRADIGHSGPDTAPVEVQLLANDHALVTEAVVLESGERKELTFEHESPDTSGSVTYALVANEERVTSNVSIRRPATFEITELTVEEPPRPGEEIRVDAIVKNTGDSAGTQEVVVRFDNGSAQHQERSIGPGETEELSIWIDPQDQSADGMEVEFSTADDSAAVMVDLPNRTTALVYQYATLVTGIGLVGLGWTLVRLRRMD